MSFSATDPVRPWEHVPGDGPVFAVVWSTGSDPRLDRVLRLAALRPSARGWERFDRFVDPGRADEAVGARTVREFGVHRRQLVGAPEIATAWREFRAFCGARTVVAPDGERAAAWFEHFAAPPEPAPNCIGLAELASLLLPGRLSLLGEGLVDALLPVARDGPSAAVLPEDVRAALAELVRRFLDGDPRAVRLAAVGYARAWHGLAACDPPAARRLAAALALVERPRAWTLGSDELFLGCELGDGRLAAACDGLPREGALLDGLAPRASEAFEAWATAPKLPPRHGSALPFPPEDERLVDELFELHLPAVLARSASLAPERAYRPAQHAVAREVARALGGEELLLVHAPTGTGKTMAYLLPALVWARRHGVRVGVATYTRALQEQAMDREVPRALAALARAGLVGGVRVSLLKGRENYVCFRSLRGLEPAPDEEPEAWLSWTRLALFALSDLDGDLDRFPRRAPIPMTSEARHRATVAGLLRAARGRAGCCEHKDDRATCAAEIARARAERSHLVITNQALALTRPEWLAHLVFDECEHLHEVAANAWSHATSLGEIGALLARLRSGSPGGGAALERLARRLEPGTAAHEAWADAGLACDRARQALEQLAREARAFERWRDQARRAVGERGEHALFRSYVAGEDGRGLVAARIGLSEACGELEAALARLCDAFAGRVPAGIGRALRTVDVVRADLGEVLEAVGAWLPAEDGRPRLSPSIFHDLQPDEQGGFELVARVLLPGDALGRFYYPQIATGVFLSAATRLRGGFEAAMGYLGLDRVERPVVEDGAEVLPGRPVRRVSAPETFDYARVLVGTPRDVPPPADKAGHLAYVSAFLLWLAERTRGRLLALFTNLEDVRRVAHELRAPFRARRLPLWFQGMEDAGKEELAERFRTRVDSVLLGVDTFWYGADFPGETLEYLVLARLPYGVPDRFHHAQCAALGEAAQRQRIYLPRALAKFRQGFGRLMRRESDRGCVFVLDPRVTQARHRMFLAELPLQGHDGKGGARLARGDSAHVLREALAHMGMLEDVRRRGLSTEYDGPCRRTGAEQPEAGETRRVPRPPSAPLPPLDVPPDALPF